MFTGIVKETGIVKKIVRKGQSYRLVIKAVKTGQTLDVGASVAVNGVCLTIVDKGEVLSFDVVVNTFKNTNLKRLKPGNIVNLEEALKVGDDLSGHIVSGHVDAERKVIKSQKTSRGWLLDIEILPKDLNLLVARGSVAVDGISLTIGEVTRNYIRIFIIPHTLENTSLNVRKPGDYVNIEFDSLAKYAKNSKNNITRDFLSQKGFL